MRTSGVAKLGEYEMSVAYRKRQSLFTKAEHEWRVEEDTLVTCDPAGTESRVFWQDVIGVRLAYAPTRMKTWRYVFVVELKNGHKIEIDNGHFAGPADFKDRSNFYVPFVRAALERIRILAPDARVRIGSGALSYFLTLSFVAVVITALTIVLFVLPTPLDYLGYPSTVKLVIIIVFSPILIRWTVKARPRTISLDEIPSDALPKIEESGAR
ncbi:MAG: hypothetical protein V3S07_09265 [Micropepsaceae bacterium]